MEEYVSYRKLITYFQKYQESQQGIGLNSFGHGNLVNFGMTESGMTPVYPFMFVTPQNVSYDENITTWTFQIIFGDRLNDDQSNQVDAISDMSIQAKRFVSYIKRGFDQIPNLYNRMDCNIPLGAVPYLERFNDYIGGVSLDIEIIVFEDINACDYYVPPTPSPTASNTPTPTNTPTVTPTITPTITPTPTCPITTQYLEVELFDSTKFKLVLWNDSGFTSAANALCDYTISGTAYGNSGTTYSGVETIASGQHQHQFNLKPVLQPNEIIIGFNVWSYSANTCVCPINLILPTPQPSPTPTNTVTPSTTPTNTPSETPTQTPTNTVTPSNTPSETPTQTPTNTITPTNTPSETPTQTPTNTVTPSNTPSETTTQTPTNTPTLTPSSTPSTICLIGGGDSNTPGSLAYSDTGTGNWYNRNAVSAYISSQVNSIAINNGRLVAIGQTFGKTGTENVIAVSDDYGLTFSGSTNGNTVLNRSSNYNGRNVIYANNLWWATAYSTANDYATSTDGFNWTGGNLTNTSIFQTSGLATDGTKILIGGQRSSFATTVQYSTNWGTTWIDCVGTGNNGGNAQTIKYLNGLWFLGFAGGTSPQRIRVSNDGITFSSTTNGDTIFGSLNGIEDFAYGNGRYVAVASDRKIGVSYDGFTWTGSTNNLTGSSLTSMSVVYDGTKFIASTDGQIGYSTDGFTWTASSGQPTYHPSGQILALCLSPTPTPTPSST